MEYTGSTRPKFAEIPNDDQESLWDYPRPPRVEESSCHVRVLAGEGVIAETHNALRIVETAALPTYYLTYSCVYWVKLRKTSGSSLCDVLWDSCANHVK